MSVVHSANQPLEKIRAISLALPEAIEKGGVAEHTFRVRDKIFAIYQDNHHGDERLALWCKAPPGLQDALVHTEPERFFAPPYVGRHGWIGIRLEGEVDWEEVADFVLDSYRMTAPQRLLASLDQR